MVSKLFLLASSGKNLMMIINILKNCLISNKNTSWHSFSKSKIIQILKETAKGFGRSSPQKKTGEITSKLEVVLE